MKEIGKWAFVIGLIVVLIASFISGYATAILLILFVLGLIVGFLNISEKDHIKFLVAIIALLTLGVGSISALSVLDIVSTYLDAILGNFIAFISAAALIVAIKAIVETTQK